MVASVAPPPRCVGGCGTFCDIAGPVVRAWPSPVRIGPAPVMIALMVSVEFERIETLELLGMTLAHLNHAEARGEVPRASRC